MPFQFFLAPLNPIGFEVKVHPDKNKSPQATEAFQRLQSAMDVLGDSDKRKIYDKEGARRGARFWMFLDLFGSLCNLDAYQTVSISFRSCSFGRICG